MTKLARKRLVFAKLETTYGDDATPSATDAMQVSNLEMTPLGGDAVERELITPYLGGQSAILSNKQAEVSFEVEVAGSGTADEAPAWGALMQACGFNETATATSGNDSGHVLYAPVSEEAKSLTLYVNRSGGLHKITGARGTLSAAFEPGQIPRWRFSFRGLYTTPAAQDVVSVDYARFKMPVLPSQAATSAFSLHGTNVSAARFEIDMGVDTPFVPYLNADAVEMTARAATGSIEFKDAGLASKNWFSEVEAGTTGALAYRHGTEEGHIVEMNAPRVQLLNPNYGDKDGVQTLTADLRLLPDAGNDDITITTR